VFIDEEEPGVGRKRFRINQPPTTDPNNGPTFMVLDGQRFERL
jgi:hypothetical protein